MNELDEQFKIKLKRIEMFRSIRKFILFCVSIIVFFLTFIAIREYLGENKENISLKTVYYWLGLSIVFISSIVQRITHNNYIGIIGDVLWILLITAHIIFFIDKYMWYHIPLVLIFCLVMYSSIKAYIDNINKEKVFKEVSEKYAQVFKDIAEDTEIHEKIQGFISTTMKCAYMLKEPRLLHMAIKTYTETKDW